MKSETLIVRPTKNDALLMASFVTGRWPGSFAIQTHRTWRASGKGHFGHFTLSGQGIQPIRLLHGILEPFFRRQSEQAPNLLLSQLLTPEAASLTTRTPGYGSLAS